MSFTYLTNLFSRAELKNPQYKVRFGVLLEAYLRYCGDYAEDLGRQVRTVDKLTFIAEIIQNSTHDELYNQVCLFFFRMNKTNGNNEYF